MLKVVSIKIRKAYTASGKNPSSCLVSHTKLNKLLEDGWGIVQTFQAPASGDHDYYTVITFILRK